MRYYRQFDYPNTVLGDGTLNTTIAQYGCYVVSIANLCGRTPFEVNDILSKSGCFERGNMITRNKEKLDIACKDLGIEYNGITYENPGVTCIAETITVKGNQHFFVINGPELMNDPISSKREMEELDYRIVSYRLFTEFKTPKLSDESNSQIELLKSGWEEIEETIKSLRDTQERFHKVANYIRGI